MAKVFLRRGQAGCPRAESRVQSDGFRSRERRAKKNMGQCHLQYRPRLQAELAGIAAQFSLFARTQVALWQNSACRVRGILRNTALWNVSNVQTLRLSEPLAMVAGTSDKAPQSRRTPWRHGFLFLVNDTATSGQWRIGLRALSNARRAPRPISRLRENARPIKL